MSARSTQLHRKTVKTGIAVITGGTGGIGTEICRRLAADGNRIISTCIAAEQESARQWQQVMEKDGYEVDVYTCDVADFDSCGMLARQIEQKYGRVDILVNAAGITRDAMLRKMEPEKWHTVINTNLDSVFNVTRHFINGMIRNNYGRIINISSVNGQKGQFGQTNYSTAKAGMIGFSRALALELADKGITVNCVCPGYVHTSMVTAIRQDVLDGIIGQIPVGRLATVGEIADAVAFLARKESAYITGTELAVNGGLWLG
jgi:acetoacetyl-CoA reductase